MNLMKVEKVPDSTYDMIGGLDQQIKEIKEVCSYTCRLSGFICSCICSILLDLNAEVYDKTFI